MVTPICSLEDMARRTGRLGTLVPWRLGMASATYAAIAAALGLLYLAYTIRFAGILRAADETESRMLARDLLKVSVLYLPLLFTTLMICAIAR